MKELIVRWVEKIYSNRVWGVLLFVLAPFLVGWAFLGFASYSWHQKMTVEVEVNGKIYSGASVVAMSVFRHPDIPLVHGNLDFGMEGEAAVVNLPDHRQLFALLTYDAGLAVKAFSDVMSLKDRQSSEKWAIVTAQKGEVRELAPKDYPLLVTFTDITDPTTVKQVEPANLAATFGPGVSLKRITLEITDEPVTEGKIESVLGWVGRSQCTKESRMEEFALFIPNDHLRITQTFETSERGLILVCLSFPIKRRNLYEHFLRTHECHSSDGFL